MDAFSKTAAWHFSAFVLAKSGEIWRLWFDGEPGAAPVMERLTPWQRKEYAEAIKQLDALEAKDAALDRYRYAVHYAGADAWDGGSDIRKRFEWARANDTDGHLSDNEAAAIGKLFLSAEGRK